MFLNGDFSAIEARGICWLAGQEDALERFRTYDRAQTVEEKYDLEPYRIMASHIYGIPTASVNKFPQRFIGKGCVLGCIAQGELVLTDAGLVPIEKVSCCHRLWDGVEWVNHEGVIYQGQKQVISYQGLVATPCHPVYCVGFSGTTDFGTAAERGLRPVISGKAGTPIRTMDTFDEQSIPMPHRVSAHESEMRMRDSSISIFIHTIQKTKPWLRSMCPQRSNNMSRSKMAGRPFGSSTFSMPEPSQSELSQLRWQGNRISFQDGGHRRQLGDGQFRTETRVGDRQGKQQWPLRAGELALYDTQGASVELSNKEDGFYLSPRRMALHQTSRLEVSSIGTHQRTDFREGMDGGFGKKKAVESNRETVACFDILNAGPRHRFTVSGKLVHNCGYGLGPTKFRVNCAKLGYKDMPAGLEDKAVKIWRKTHPKVVAFWYELEGAAKRAIVDRGKVYAAGKHIKFQCRNEGGMNFLLMRLPSGRMISYPKPRIQADRIIHFGNIPLTQKWGDLSIWGGTLANNSCQGVCADVMTNAAHNLERSGYEICTLIHDESLAYWQQKHRDAGLTPEGFNRCMTTLPAWAAGLPVASDGGVVPFYLKN